MTPKLDLKAKRRMSRFTYTLLACMFGVWRTKRVVFINWTWLPRYFAAVRMKAGDEFYPQNCLVLSIKYLVFVLPLYLNSIDHKL